MHGSCPVLEGPKSSGFWGGWGDGLSLPFQRKISFLRRVRKWHTAPHHLGFKFGRSHRRYLWCQRNRCTFSEVYCRRDFSSLFRSMSMICWKVTPKGPQRLVHWRFGMDRYHWSFKPFPNPNYILLPNTKCSKVYINSTGNIAGGSYMAFIKTWWFHVFFF